MNKVIAGAGIVVAGLVIAVLLFNDNGPFALHRTARRTDTPPTTTVASPIPPVAPTAAARTATAPSAPKAQPAPRPGPEDIVVFPNSNIVCLKQADLQQALTSGLRGEETKLRAMVGDLAQGAPCYMVPPTKRLKVLSVNYSGNDPVGLLEVVGEHTTAASGAWALSVGATIVQERSKR
jgi:hypothetical protein